jgi:hypothetical protein
MAEEALKIHDKEMRKLIILRWLEDHQREELLLEGFRDLVDSHDRAVWPGLAALTVEYYASRQPIDAFFRQAADLLKATTFEDVGALNSILHLAQTYFPRGLLPLEIDGKNGTLRAFREIRDESKHYIEHYIEAPFPPVVEPFHRALRLLKSNGFGHDCPTGRYDGGSDPSASVMFDLSHMPQIERLHRLVEICASAEDASSKTQ